MPPIECEEDVDCVGLDIAREMVLERVMGWAKLGWGDSARESQGFVGGW